ncbi:MarR family winged helix-turn-helix transcriptional regulator [Nocardia sp. CDC160]|uniref:MarR family winged helix-turn-helix transcriptional regulator n=1 Tax=Nocardia sp. CDC160 TaxID=3112166 RepID=UPI002DB8944E|nr:MarR family winged helix-turn-helix transcriptional regulator [Nocardia sp. CDC160]MEC3915226.1 MarR family winged helix-turn-helix transcriptional regulator [Nocardia sp. CDC160]
MKDNDPAIVAIERAMVAIRRSQTRRALNKFAARAGGPAVDPTVFGVLDAVEARDGETTVSDIATALGVDQPRASRLVARAVAEGLLERRADQEDARRIHLHLTAAARTALGRAHTNRQAVFAEATASWTDRDRTEFARLLTKFVADFEATTARD